MSIALRLFVFLIDGLEMVAKWSIMIVFMW